MRQSVAFAALAGQAVHLMQVRVRRPNPGLRPQHMQVVEAIRQLMAGTTTDHIQSNAWLARQFLGAEVRIQGHTLMVSGVGFQA